MQITKNQKHLINILKMLEMKYDLIELTVLSCQTEEETLEMLEYLIKVYDKNKIITEQDILKKIVEMD